MSRDVAPFSMLASQMLLSSTSPLRAQRVPDGFPSALVPSAPLRFSVQTVRRAAPPGGDPLRVTLLAPSLSCGPPPLGRRVTQAARPLARAARHLLEKQRQPLSESDRRGTGTDTGGATPVTPPVPGAFDRKLGSVAQLPTICPSWWSACTSCSDSSSRCCSRRTCPSSRSC